MLKIGGKCSCAATGRVGWLVARMPNWFLLADVQGQRFSAKQIKLKSPARRARWRKGEVVLAAEPVFGREMILAEVLDPQKMLVRFLEHPVWRGAVLRVEIIRPCDSELNSARTAGGSLISPTRPPGPSAPTSVANWPMPKPA